MRTLLADSDLAARGDLRAVLEAAGRPVVAEAGHADDAFVAAVAWQPDVAVLDGALPGGAAVLVEQLTRVLPAVVVLVLTRAGRTDEVAQAVSAGAAGCVVKDGGPTAVLRALDAVLAGHAVLPACFLRAVVGAGADGAARRTPAAVRAGLTVRECEVLELDRRGLSSREIAALLRVAPVTVRSHRAALRRKLQQTASERGPIG